MKLTKGKRLFALMLCMCVAAAFAPITAMAETGVVEDANVKISVMNGSPYETDGVVTVPLLVENTNTTAAVTIKTIALKLTSASALMDASYAADTGESTIKVEANAQRVIIVSSKVLPKTTKLQSEEIYQVSYSVDGGAPSDLVLELKTGIRLTDTSARVEPIVVEEDTQEPANPNATLSAALVLDSTAVDGSSVPAPSGNAGDRIQLRLPIRNRNTRTGLSSANRISGITVTPVISATLDNFPFVIEEVDYTRSLPDMSGGAKQELVYDFQISKKATSGVKEVKFNAVYYNNAKTAFETATFSAFVNVIKGAAPAEAGMTDGDGNVITSTPKLIVESYTVTPLAASEEGQQSNRLFAGDSFELTFTVRNTAEDEAIKNIQIRLEDSGGAILPAEGGSNSLYIKSIPAGGSEQKTIRMQTLPEAAEKSHSLSVNLGYESGKTQKSYEATETLTLPVAQRMRVKLDDPTIYETEVMSGGTTGVYFGLYNMGKSTLYNCMVDVEGDGLRMEESYFGGNIAAGGSMRADFSIVAQTPGEIAGNILITYEDVSGAQTLVKKPFTLNVLDGGEDMSMGLPPLEDGYIDENGNFIPFDGPAALSGLMPWWALAIIIAVVIGAGIAVIVRLRRRRRKKELEAV